MQDVQQNKHKTSTVNVLCLGISFPIAAIQRYKENNESRENGTWYTGENILNDCDPHIRSHGRQRQSDNIIKVMEKQTNRNPDFHT